MKTLLFFFIVFFSLVMSGIASTGMDKNWFAAIDGSFTKLSSIQRQSIDSVAGNGWDRIVYVVTTSLDTVEKSATNTRIEQLEIQSQLKIIADPEITDRDLTMYLKNNDRLLKSNRSLHYLPKFLWMYKDVTITERKIVSVQDSLKLNVSKSTKTEAADTLIFAVIFISICLTGGFTLRRFFKALEDKTCMTITVLFAAIPYIIGIASGYILFSFIWVDLISFIVLWFMAVVIFSSSANFLGDENHTKSSTVVLVIILAMLTLMFFNQTKSILFAVATTGWFIFLYFFSYVLALIVTKIFSKQIMMIGEVKVFA